MDVIEKAKELAQAIAQDERCRRLQVARAANDADTALQELIGRFNLQKMQLGTEYKKEPPDRDRIKEMEQAMRSLYGEIMKTPAMTEYSAAKDAMDELVAQINAIIQLSVSGEVDTDGCSGDCGGCAGCAGCH